MVHLNTLVLAWHGTRNPSGRATIEAIAGRVATLLPGVGVHLAWVDAEAAGPTQRGRSLSEVLDAVGPCVVVPCFLAAGHHVTHDVPRAAEGSPHGVEVTAHLGGSLTGALRDRADEAGGPGDAVVLAVVGSRRDEARTEVDALAGSLSAHWGVPVGVANLFGTPSVADAVACAHAGGARDVLVLPATLAPGLGTDRLAGMAAPAASGRGVRVARPLGEHPDVAATIAARHAALAQRRPTTVVP